MSGKVALLEVRQLDLETLNCLSTKLLQVPLRGGFLALPSFIFLLWYFHALSSFLPILSISQIQDRSLQKPLILVNVLYEIDAQQPMLG